MIKPSNTPNFFALAMNKLYPGYAYAIRSNNDLVWTSEEPSNFSLEELKVEEENIKIEYDSKEYQRQRAIEYPPLTDLADAMYWASQGDNTKLDAYYAACEAVKQKYPKAE